MGDRFVNKLKTDRGAVGGLCRLCATLKLRKVDCFVHIRDPNLNIIEKLERCCQVALQENDNLPENVCLECVRSLEKSWDFAEKVREAQESLQALYTVEDVVIEQADVQDDVKDSSLQEDLSKRFIEFLDTTESIKGSSSKSRTDAVTQSTNAKTQESALFIENHDNLDDETEDSTNDVLLDVYKCQPETLDEYELIETASNQDENTEIIDVWRDYPWICTVCGDIFPGLVELREHAHKDHNLAECVYICADCSKSYTKYYLFFNHVVSHRGHLNSYCDLCSDFCQTPNILAKHRENHKNEDNIALCSICAKAFKNMVSLVSHLRMHKEEQMYQCNTCYKKFGSKPNLKAHQKIHVGVKEFVCEQCGKGFVQKANLEEHLITHLKEEPFVCNECDKSFKTLARLAKHKTVHSSVRPHKCEQCGKEFREKDTLRIHMRIHTGVRPYECEFCGKHFRFRSILVTHRHQHTGVRPYSCQECDHHFTNWPNYNKHMKRRHGVSVGRKITPSGSEKRTASASNSTPATIISFHSYSTPGLDTSTTELENFLEAANHAKEIEDDGNGAANSSVSGAIRHRNPSSTKGSESLVKFGNY